MAFTNCCCSSYACKFNFCCCICYNHNKFDCKKERIDISVIVILIGISLIVALGFLFAFLWAVKSGQYKDTYTPSVRMLFDQSPDKEKNEENSKE
ncbi:MAG: cbb3-type cytochrome oxidase assembly protein CcoS [Ignavibacteriaceae bacterium]